MQYYGSMDVQASMNADSKRWDSIHKKLHKEDDRHSHYADEKEKLFPRGSIVCDLGGGTGNDCLYFLKKGHSVILLDLSSFALEVAKKRAHKDGLDSNLITNQIDFGLHTLPLKDNSVDVCYSRISLNYFGSRHTARILKDIYRALKPGGKAFLTFKSPADQKEMARLWRNAVEYEPGVYIEAGQLRSRFSIEQLQKIAQTAGISNPHVNHYEEHLGKHSSGMDQVLFQNELSFTK